LASDQTQMRKRIFIAIGIVAVLAVAAIVVFTSNRGPSAITLTGELETTPTVTGPLSEIIGATGIVSSNQSAILQWKTSGFVRETHAQIGDTVQAGDVLATLEQNTLSPNDIRAQVDLVSAQQALDDLLNSRLEQASAQQAVEAAQEALDEAHNPELAQAKALQAIAEAQQEVADAEYQLTIQITPISQNALNQAQANLVLAEKKLNDTLGQIERIEKKLNKPEDKYKFWESRKLYKRILEGLELQRIQHQIAYENSLQKYQDLQAPPNPNDVAVAKANLLHAQGQLSEAEREWARIKDGTSPADIALLEAQLSDALREWERLRDGPTIEDISAAQARVAAAQATLNQASLIAPFNGTITDVNTKRNDQVSSGTPAFRLDDLSHLWIDVDVSEIDINNVEVGQPVILTYDAMPDKEYHGLVVEVSPVGNEVLGVVNFKVTVELTDADADVRPGMTAAVEIIVSRVDEALLVPNRAVKTLEGEFVVYILSKNGQMEPVEITLGASSDKFSQVLAGNLNPGDLVVLNPFEL
jgi:HlyD family secretion protein